jgi:DUF4097 and DUF4098 domain-containing protein YvlB
MKEIIAANCCKYCGTSIPETRNKGAIYCTNRCGWTFRNDSNSKKRKKQKESEPGLYKNFEIVKNLVRMGVFDISIETATELGLDFNCHMGVISFDKEKENTEFRVFEYSLTISGNRIKIKKLTDECS